MLLNLLRERKNFQLFVLNIILGILESVMLLWQISYVKEVFDFASKKEHLSLYTALTILGLLILGTMLVRNATTYYHDLFIIKFRNSISKLCLKHILSSEHNGEKELHSGDIMSRIVQDIGSVTMFLSDTSPRILSNIVLLLGAFIYLCYINYKIALCIIIISPFFILCSKLFFKKEDYFINEVRNNETQAQTLLQEVIQNKLTIKVNRTIDYFIEKYTKFANMIESSIVNKTCYTMRMSILLSSGFSIIYLITLGWGCILLADGAITLGEMAAILQLSDRIQNPARSLSELIPQCAGFFVANRRLNAINQMFPETSDFINLEPPLGIIFEDVTFSYTENGNEVFRNLSFCFKPNSFTIVKGESGVGKTTMVNLILSIYKPKNGHIYIYNENMKELVTPAMRDYIEYVPQGNNLLSGTVEENLKIGNPEASPNEMKEALRNACADFIINGRDGLLTVCAEKGTGFSEGQAQRIMIARALLRKKPILILDEATSALDENTEKLLMGNLRSMKSKTIIFITHKKHLENKGDLTLNL